MSQLKLCFRKHCSPPVLQNLNLSLSLIQSRLFYQALLLVQQSCIQIIIPFQDWWLVRYNTEILKIMNRWNNNRQIQRFESVNRIKRFFFSEARRYKLLTELLAALVVVSCIAGKMQEMLTALISNSSQNISSMREIISFNLSTPCITVQNHPMHIYVTSAA